MLLTQKNIAKSILLASILAATPITVFAKAAPSPSGSALNAIEGTITKIEGNKLTVSYDVDGYTKDNMEVVLNNSVIPMKSLPLIQGEYVTAYGHFSEKSGKENLISTGIYSFDDDEYYSLDRKIPYYSDKAKTTVGVVKEVEDNNLKLAVGENVINVKVDSLGFNPLDEEMMTDLNKGDVIQVTGEYTPKWLSNDTLVAAELYTLHRVDNI